MESDAGYNIADPNVLRGHADADQAAGRRPVVLPELVLRGDVDPVVGSFDVALEPGEDTENVTLTVARLLDDVA